MSMRTYELRDHGYSINPTTKECVEYHLSLRQGKDRPGAVLDRIIEIQDKLKSSILGIDTICDVISFIARLEMAGNDVVGVEVMSSGKDIAIAIVDTGIREFPSHQIRGYVLSGSTEGSRLIAGKTVKTIDVLFSLNKNKPGR